MAAGKPSYQVMGEDGKMRDETEEERKFRIVGALESDITKSLISINSPIAKAVLGKSIDDIVKISAPGGMREYVIASIQYR